MSYESIEACIFAPKQVRTFRDALWRCDFCKKKCSCDFFKLEKIRDDGEVSSGLTDILGCCAKVVIKTGSKGRCRVLYCMQPCMKF